MFIATYYIYRHIRPDKDEVFYIGRGKMALRAITPRRAFSSKRRNYIWNGIVTRNQGCFDVEIMFWSDSKDEILLKEKEFIKLYGKIIDKNGTLCNMTDGGDGAAGLRHTEESRRKMSLTRKNNPSLFARFTTDEFKKHRKEKLAESPLPHFMVGRKASEKTRAILSEQRRGGKHPEAKKVINTTTGEIYSCVEEAANANGIKRDTLYKYLRGVRFRNKTTLKYV